MKVFLGGTCNGSKWRDRLIPMLKVDSFNPVVENWTPEAQAEELKQREECDICLYVITSKMYGVYSIAEVVDDSNKRPGRTVAVWLQGDGGFLLPETQVKSMNAVMELVRKNGAVVLDSLEAVADYVNKLGNLEFVKVHLN